MGKGIPEKGEKEEGCESPLKRSLDGYPLPLERGRDYKRGLHPS